MVRDDFMKEVLSDVLNMALEFLLLHIIFQRIGLMFLQVEIILSSKLLVTTKLKSDVMYFVHL